MSLLTQISAEQQTGNIPFKSLEESESLLLVSTYGLLWMLNLCPCSLRWMVTEYHTARDPHLTSQPTDLALAKIMLILKDLCLFHFSIILLWFACVWLCVCVFFLIYFLMYLWRTQIVVFLYHSKEMIQYVILADTWNIIKFLPSIRENWTRLPICTICKLHLIFSTLVSWRVLVNSLFI